MPAESDAAVAKPRRVMYREDGVRLPVVCWRLAAQRQAISSGPLGGLVRCEWVINATVPVSYRRHDPDVHLTGIAAQLGLPDALGVGMMTAVDVSRHRVACDGGVTVSATVGIAVPTWAAAPVDDQLDPASSHNEGIGTINVVAQVPARLSEAALVNTVATVAEAKAQALWECGIAATGTATDATCVLCLQSGPVQVYGGPRSPWGSRLARAVHAAVRQGVHDWLSSAKRRAVLGTATVRSAHPGSPVATAGQVASSTPATPEHRDRRDDLVQLRLAQQPGSDPRLGPDPHRPASGGPP